MAGKKLLCISRNGKKVYWDDTHSHAATHFADTPQLKNIVVEVLTNRDLNNENIEFDVNIGKIIGTTDIVKIGRTDNIVYAKRKNRHDQGYVPFVKSRKAIDSSYISISLIPRKDMSYSLSSAWIGKWNDIPFPQEPHATETSKNYWSKHAFVWDSQEIEPNTETSVCPW